MDEQTQAQFIQWLGSQLNVSTEEELQQALGQIDDDQMQELFTQFQQESQAQAFKKGGQINYLKKLGAFKKGGKAKKDVMCASKVKTANGGYKPSKKWDFGKGKQDRQETKTIKSLGDLRQGKRKD